MNREFIFDFFDSLSCQSYVDFDVIVINDGFEDFAEVVDMYENLSIVEIKCQKTPAKNREFGIRFAKNNGYDVLVFGDSDDTFSENRIENSLELLKCFDIVVNDLTLVSETATIQERYLSNRIKMGAEINAEFIQDKNIFGFTNTAINLNKIETINFQNELIAVDWYFFTFLLLRGLTAIFTNDSLTYYRQHDESLVGLGQKMTLNSFQKGLDVKLKHYANLPELSDCYHEVKKLSELELEDLSKLILCSYIDFPFWWEEVRSINI